MIAETAVFPCEFVSDVDSDIFSESNLLENESKDFTGRRL